MHKYEESVKLQSCFQSHFSCFAFSFHQKFSFIPSTLLLFLSIQPSSLAFIFSTASFPFLLAFSKCFSPSPPSPSPPPLFFSRLFPSHLIFLFFSFHFFLSHPHFYLSSSFQALFHSHPHFYLSSSFQVLFPFTLSVLSFLCSRNSRSLNP